MLVCMNSTISITVHIYILARYTILFYYLAHRSGLMNIGALLRLKLFQQCLLLLDQALNIREIILLGSHVPLHTLNIQIYAMYFFSKSNFFFNF